MGSALQKFIGFFLFPIYTRVLTQEAYGAQDLIFTAVTITTYFIVLGLDAGTARNYYDAKTQADRRKILSTYLWFELLISIPISVLLISYASDLCVLLFRDSGLSPYFRLAVASLPFTMLGSVALMSLRLTFRSKTYSFVTASSVAVQALASIYLVAILRMDVMGVFLAHFVANAFRACLGLSLTYRQFGFKFSTSWIKAMLSFGLPLVPASLSIWILNSSNRYFLVRSARLSDIGILGVGNRIASVVIFVISAFRTAWGPFAYSLIEDASLASRTYSRVMTYFLFSTSLVTVGLSIFAREAILILATPEYQASSAVIPLLAFSAIAWGAVSIVSIGYSISKKSYHTTVATILGAIVNTSLNVLLIPNWGIMGAALATLIGNVVAFIYGYVIAQRHFYVHYEYTKVVVVLTASALAALGAVLIDGSFPNWDPQIMLYKLPIFLSFVGSFFAFKIIGRTELQWVKKNLIRRIYRPQSTTSTTKGS